MASAISLSQTISLDKSPKLTTIKALVAESPGLISIPPSYTFTKDPQVVSDPEDPIPVIDFSFLAGSPQQRSTAIHDLARACQDWGFFMLINHGIPESLMKGMINGCKEFFDLTEEEKEVFAGKHVLDPIRCGTSFNASVENVLSWRDFLKVFVHPEFHSPDNPLGFSALSLEYSKRVREIARELLRAICESLGLEACYIEKTMNMEEGFQILIANLYPPCPQPDLAMGLPPHSDHGLLTLLAQNEIGGLQLLHNGKWLKANAPPNSFLVNTADQLEILSNGKYKSVLHRAAVNGDATRISIAVAHGPALDTVVRPAQELMERENEEPAYNGMKYREYLELQQSNQLDRKFCLDKIRILK